MSDVNEGEREIWDGQIWLCPEHVETPGDCDSCGLKPYVPRADVHARFVPAKALREAEEEKAALRRAAVDAICKQEEARAELRRVLWAVADAARLLTPGMKAGVAEAKELLVGLTEGHQAPAESSVSESEAGLDGSERC